MISVPILAGALMRFPLGVLSQYIGRKNAAMVEMALIVLALLYGFFFVDTLRRRARDGRAARHRGRQLRRRAVAGQRAGSRRSYKGLAMGIAGAGNSGTVLAVLFAPPLAHALRLAARSTAWPRCTMLLPMLVMWFVRQGAARLDEHQTLREHVSCLFEKDGWAFSLIYIVTFGGFIGLASFLPTYFYDQFKVTKVEAGQLTMLATLMGSAVRVVGGYVSDRVGGINTLTAVLVLVCVAAAASAVRRQLGGADHAAVHALLRGTGRRQRRAVPAGAAALAADDGGGRLDDRRDRRAGRRLPARTRWASPSSSPAPTCGASSPSRCSRLLMLVMLRGCRSAGRGPGPRRVAARACRRSTPTAPAADRSTRRRVAGGSA